MFFEGFSERAHVAVVEYLRERHRELGTDAVNTMDLYRKLRHSVAYGLETVIAEKDAAKAQSFANAFLAKVRALLRAK